MIGIIFYMIRSLYLLVLYYGYTQIPMSLIGLAPGQIYTESATFFHINIINMEPVSNACLSVWTKKTFYKLDSWICFYPTISYINHMGICSSHFTGQADQPNDITILAWIAFSHEADTLHIMWSAGDFPHDLCMMRMPRRDAHAVFSYSRAVLTWKSDFFPYY